VSTILIVDDYPDALQVWDLYLRASGFEVLTAADGEAALAQATTHHPDLIVMDLELPGMSGAEVARALRAQDSTRRIPKIAVTGYSQPRQLDEARKSGFDDILIKPCDPDELIAVIKRLLNGSSAGDASHEKPSSSSG
jgi:CheY-like chemotaxis protein